MRYRTDGVFFAVGFAKFGCRHRFAQIFVPERQVFQQRARRVDAERAKKRRRFCADAGKTGDVVAGGFGGAQSESSISTPGLNPSVV
jgi:hypothetical protein